jgi:hypothetical protein
MEEQVNTPQASSQTPHEKVKRLRHRGCELSFEEDTNTWIHDFRRLENAVLWQSLI